MTALAQSWALHLAHAFWQATAAGAILLLAVRLLPRSSPRFRHALVLLAAVKFGLPPMLPLPTGLFSAAPSVPDLATVRDGVATIDPGLLVLLMFVHAAGAALMLSRLAREAWRVRGIVRRSTAGEDGVLLTNEVPVPLAAGVLRPVVLLPRTLACTVGHEDLRVVIAHERQHVRMGDARLNALQALVSAVWWFHPLAHLLEREGRALREERCDDAVVGSGLVETAQYARTLLNAACAVTARTPSAAAAISESRGSLLRRVRRLAVVGFAPSSRLHPAAIAALILAALLLLPGLRVSQANRFAFDHETRHAVHHRH